MEFNGKATTKKRVNGLDKGGPRTRRDICPKKTQKQPGYLKRLYTSSVRLSCLCVSWAAPFPSLPLGKTASTSLTLAHSHVTRAAFQALQLLEKHLHWDFHTCGPKCHSIHPGPQAQPTPTPLPPGSQGPAYSHQSPQAQPTPT